MRSETSTDAKNKFGEVLDAAKMEPVLINKNGRSVAVIMSFEKYKLYQALEDRYWGEMALEAEKEGYLGTDASMNLLNQLSAQHK